MVRKAADGLLQKVMKPCVGICTIIIVFSFLIATQALPVNGPAAAEDPSGGNSNFTELHDTTITFVVELQNETSDNLTTISSVAGEKSHENHPPQAPTTTVKSIEAPLQSDPVKPPGPPVKTTKIKVEKPNETAPVKKPTEQKTEPAEKVVPVDESKPATVKQKDGIETNDDEDAPRNDPVGYESKPIAVTTADPTVKSPPKDTKLDDKTIPVDPQQISDDPVGENPADSMAANKDETDAGTNDFPQTGKTKKTVKLADASGNEQETTKKSGDEAAFPEQENSHFFAYFLTVVAVCVLAYFVLHNKQKIIALIVEGRHNRRKRFNSYRKLENEGTKGSSQPIF